MFGRFFPRGSAVATPIFSATFSDLALGGHSASSFNTATGLTFARATDSTVQTSSSTLISSVGGNDYVAIGQSNGSNKGLVLQPCVFNILSGTTSPRNLTDTWIAGSSVTVTYPYADSPDENVTGCSRANVSSGGYAPFGSGIGGPNMFSSWQRSTNASSNGNMQQVWITTVPSDGILVRRSASNTWGRLVLSRSSGGFYIDVCDARDYTGAGGDAAQARDILVDYIQVERGLNATEAIPTAQTRRRSDQLSHPDASALVVSGRIKTYMKFYPKHASSIDVSYSSIVANNGEELYWYLWSFTDIDYYMRVDASTKQLKVKNGAAFSEITSSNAISWSADDKVEIYVEIGANIASVAKYKINDGSWNDLVLGTVTNNFNPGSTPLAIGRNIARDAETLDTGHLLCRLAEIKFYGATGLTV